MITHNIIYQVRFELLHIHLHTISHSFAMVCLFFLMLIIVGGITSLLIFDLHDCTFFLRSDKFSKARLTENNAFDVSYEIKTNEHQWIFFKNA